MFACLPFAWNRQSRLHKLFSVISCVALLGMLISCGSSDGTSVQPPPVTPTPVPQRIIVRGSVSDSIGAPFAGASVSMSGSRPVTSAVSAADGMFSLSAEPGAYLLTISYTERALVTQSVTVGATTVELGVIRLPKVSVSGIVNDTEGHPVAGAQVAVSETSQAAAKAFGAVRQAMVQAAAASAVVTLADGSFTLQVDPGTYGLTVSLNNMVLLDTGLVATQAPFQSVGALIVNTDFNTDTDGDGLADVVETNGWDILLDEFGSGEYTRRHVNSDPAVADTDNDTLSDQFEYAYKTDPRRRDTDGDALTDVTEMNVYFSHPGSVDSDADARGPQGTGFPNPRLFDGSEANRPCAVPVGEGQLNVCATSPTLADSDGDGLTDHEEILGGGFNPLRADLPNVQLDVAGDPVAVLNIDFEGGVESKSVQSVLERESVEHAVTDTKTDKFSLEFGYKAEAGVSGVKVHASASWEFKAAMALEASHTTSSTSARESQKNLEEAIGRNEVQRYKDGMLSVPMRLRNSSSLSVKVTGLDIIASRVRPSTYGSTSLVGTLTPKNMPVNGWTLSPGSDVLFEATNQELNGLLMQPVIANPAAMQFELGTLEMHQVDASGQAIKDFGAIGQTVLERCGLIVIDYGNGRIDRHALASNVFRNPDGSSAGVNVLQALRNIAGLDVEIDDDPRYVRRIGNVSGNPATRSYWAIAGEGSEFALDSPTRFDELTLKHGQRITLMYQSDSDADGLTDREEWLLGTTVVQDSDGDGIQDWDEVKQGWDVEFKDLDGNPIAGLTRRVFSDPRSPDADGDGLNDAAERSSDGKDATDPNLPDTDHDGTSDALDTVADAREVAGSPRVGLLSYYTMDRADFEATSGYDYPTGIVADQSGNNHDLIAYALPSDTAQMTVLYGEGLSLLNLPWYNAGLYTFPNRHNVANTASYFFYNYGSSGQTFSPAPGVALMLGQTLSSAFPAGSSVTISSWVYLDPRYCNPVLFPCNYPFLGYASMWDLDWEPADNDGWSGTVLAKTSMFSLALTDGVMGFRYNTGAGETDIVSVQDSERLERRRWHHFAGVFDATTSTVKLYRDGNLISRNSRSLDLAGIDTRESFGIGYEFKTGLDIPYLLVGDIFKGALDEVRVYNRALSDDEIVRLSQDSGPVTTAP